MEQRTPTGRARNGKSLKQVVLEVLADKSMTKHEILDAVLRAGYQFSTDDPLNSLGVILYGKSPKFIKTRVASSAFLPANVANGNGK
jgi:hypothetical protein